MPRDLTLTIDAGLQSHVAAIVARHAAKSASKHAAAVVLDPASGDVLAVSSYPFPALDGSRAGSEPARRAGWIGAIRPLPARLDIQACDGRGSAAP